MFDRYRFAAVAVLTLAVGCSSYEVNAQRDSSVPIPASPTWAWGRRDSVVSQYELDPVAQNPMLHQRVIAAIEANLNKRGWHKVEDASQANLIVTYHIGLKRESAMQTTTTGAGVYGTPGYGGWYGGYGWGYYGAPAWGATTTTQVVNYNTGGLLIFVREGSSGKVAWYGLFKKDVHDVDQIHEEGIIAAVNATLKELRN
jgi:hypothetical protein